MAKLANLSTNSKSQSCGRRKQTQSKCRTYQIIFSQIFECVESATKMIDELMADASILMELLKIVVEIKKPIQLSVGDKHYTIDMANKKITKGKATGGVEVALEFKEADFNSIVEGKLKPVQAFMQGKIKAKGNLATLMKLQPLEGKFEAIKQRHLSKL